MFDFGFNIVQGFESVSSYLENILTSIASVFTDVNFVILYNWLPSDIASAITACIVVLFWLALFGILRRVLFFIG